MKKIIFLLAIFMILSAGMSAAGTVLEPFEYFEDFETRSLRAWAAYPLWQDTAYDPNFRVNEIVPGDPNISVVQIVTPYTNVDNYAGAQKLFDIWLVPGSEISLKYYLKTNMPVESFKVRLAAGKHGQVDCTVVSPVTNSWQTVSVGFEDFVAENPCLAGESRIKVNALAVIAKIPDADPAMPIYFGLDDVSVKAAEDMKFKFAAPSVMKLSEFKPYIAEKHYAKGSTFALSGQWPLDADTVKLEITEFADSANSFMKKTLVEKNGVWSMKSFKMGLEKGMYRGALTAFCSGGNELSTTEFTFVVAPDNIAGKHPRLWFDAEEKDAIEGRLKTEKFSKLYDGFESRAAAQRKKLPVDSVEYVADQFPAEKWLPTLGAWGQLTVRTWGTAAETNALAYAFRQDEEAGRYVVELLAKMAMLPDWNHPWLANRGRYTYHPSGVMHHKIALSYDLCYELMDDYQRKIIRKAFFEKAIVGNHRTYVEDDMVTCDTSNWIAHTTGGAAMLMATMYGDGNEVVEPYFSGAVYKLWDFITATHGADGSYGEGFSYNSYTNYTLQENLPALENVFGIDLHGPLDGAYQEAVWSGFIKNKRTFDFGDSHQSIRGLYRWTWLVDKFKDPLMSWLFDYGQDDLTIYDAIYQPELVPQKTPFDENPVRVFRDVGTTVFKSGWDTDDFVFVLRTGPFINHQHIDQGTFWLADRGVEFVAERNGSHYYDDQYYQSHYTQPVGHSTVLINGNHQSQRVGDHVAMAEGFSEHAFISHFLDGSKAAFTRGDIGRLYWGEVDSMQRNVLYIKPRTVIMIDTIDPGAEDVDVTLLYQAARFDEIAAAPEKSTISHGGSTLHFSHLWPTIKDVNAVETPHYLNALKNDKPLVRQGMLTVNARTAGVPMVMANILTTTTEGSAPDIETVSGDGFVKGAVNGVIFAVSTNPGAMWETGPVRTDALATTYEGSAMLIAMCSYLEIDGKIIVESDAPMTFEKDLSTVKYYRCTAGEAFIGAEAKPSSVTLNGQSVKDFEWIPEKGAVKLSLPAGEGVIVVE